MDSLLFQAAIYLGAATLCVPVAVRLGLGSVLGYLVAGIVIGPLTGLVGSETTDLQHVAEFGVVMMLFLIGLELDPRTLWGMRARLVGLGLGQVVLTTLAVAALATAFGLAWQVAVAVGMVFALSSTAIVMQTLEEKDLTATRGGRSAFSVLLAQDIAVIPMIALMPLLATGHGHGAGGHGEAAVLGDGQGAVMAAQAASWVDALPGWGLALLTVTAVAVVMLGGRFLTRPIFTFAARAGLREMNTVVSLLFVVGVAALMALVGLSPALGTFLAGVVLANSEFRHELEADIEPFKGLLLGLFFVTVGAGIDFDVLAAAPGIVLGTVAGLIAVKGAILFGLSVLARLRGRDRILFTLSLAQAGEFGFVLLSVAAGEGVLDRDVSGVLLLAVALSMLVTPLLFLAYERLAARSAAAPGETAPDDAVDAPAEIIVAGVGRFGQVVHRMLQGAGLRSVVLDRDIETIRLLRSFGIKTYLGDPTRPELLEAAGLRRAKVLVIALDDRAAAVRLARMARAANPGIRIVARAYDRVHTYELYRAGADDIVREMFDGSLRAGRYVLEGMGWSEDDALAARDAFFRHDRSALLALAKVWKPGVTLEDNPEYRALAQAYNRELESALLQRFGEDHEAAEEAVREAPVRNAPAAS